MWGGACHPIGIAGCGRPSRMKALDDRRAPSPAYRSPGRPRYPYFSVPYGQHTPMPRRHFAQRLAPLRASSALPLRWFRRRPAQLPDPRRFPRQCSRVQCTRRSSSQRNHFFRGNIHTRLPSTSPQNYLTSLLLLFTVVAVFVRQSGRALISTPGVFFQHPHRWPTSPRSPMVADNY